MMRFGMGEALILPFQSRLSRLALLEESRLEAEEICPLC
jgi:hypothetical protein